MGLFDWVLKLFGAGGNPAADRPADSASNRTPGPDNTSNQPQQPARTAPPPRPQPQPPVSANSGPRQPAPTAPPPPQVDPLTGLDLGQFAPLTTAEATEHAKTLGPTAGGPWFGNRNNIPPATDPRTNLIDRAMVGRGFLSPQELAEIHAVGDQMSRLRPDLAFAHELARQAVANDAAARERLKAEKKAAAAERRRLQAEAVAERRATDIVYLGREVSQCLADRTANSELLAQFELPHLATPGELAAAMELSISKLRWLAFHQETAKRVHYIQFTVPKKSGGVRTLAAPHRDLARLQHWILKNILERIPLHDAAHGFVPGRSTVTNAQPHVGRAVVVNADLKDFFPSITFPRVRGLFTALGFSPAVSTILALICTESPRKPVVYAGQRFHVATGPRALPQGACTSPALSNMVAWKLDARLAGIAAKLGWHYTRYADDLTFSGRVEQAEQTGYLLARLRHIAEDEGFTVNEKKTRVQRRNTAQSVTGIVVNDRPGVPRELVRRLRAILHRAKTEGLARQNREEHPHFEAWVLGQIAYIAMVNPQQGETLRAALAQVRE